MTTPRPSIDIHTFGCRLNAYESEVIRNHLAATKLDDVIVINTCAVTAEAERQARQAIRRAHRNHPGKRIVVTGCAAQINPANYAAIDGVDLVLGNSEKLNKTSWTALAGNGPQDVTSVRVNDIMSVTETANHLISGFNGKARAFVQVQQGCNHRCTFCIIPFGRGPSRAVPVGEVIRQGETLVDNGCKEVVLTGVDLTDYGNDLPGQPCLGSLAKRVLMHVSELPRLRLSSLDPVEVDDQLLDLIAEEPRLLPYFHLSIQAGDDTILKRMKRRHGRADTLAVCRIIRERRPDATLGADLIAGFPTETDAMFENTLALIDDCKLSHLHVFPYSPREATPAARMPQVPNAIRRKRAALLREAGTRQMSHALTARENRDIDVLVEKDATGYCAHYLKIELDREITPGTVVTARAMGHDGTRLQATVLS